MFSGSDPVVSDDVLLEAVARRDAASFRELHDRLAGLVYQTAFRVLNDPDDAREVAQDVFAHLWEKADLFRSRKGKASTWVYAMTRNRAIDRLRANRRRFRLRDEYREESEVRLGARSWREPGTEAQRRDEFRRAQGAMGALTPDQREAIGLVYGEDLSLREAAERLGLPVGTVKARVRRGLMALREKLGRP
jgi:RNA polymerase sigma-70 factor (ECF subfamily)